MRTRGLLLALDQGSSSSRAVLFDLLHVVGERRAATCRTLLGTGAQEDTGVWRLTSQPVPASDATARCEGVSPS